MSRNPYADICANRHGGNAESIDANVDTARKKDRDRAAILKQYRNHGPQTCAEIEAALDMPHQTCSARISELKADGLLEPTKDRRETPTGSLARVLRIAEPEPPAAPATPPPATPPPALPPRAVTVTGQGLLFELERKTA